MTTDRTAISVLRNAINLVQTDSRNADKNNYQKQNRKQVEGKNNFVDEAMNHLDELTIAADRLNKYLVEIDSLYRFELFEIENAIFAKVLVHNSSGTVIDEKIVDITNHEFSDLLSHILNGEGVLFDMVG